MEWGRRPPNASGWNLLLSRGTAWPFYTWLVVAVVAAGSVTLYINFTEPSTVHGQSRGTNLPRRDSLSLQLQWPQVVHRRCQVTTALLLALSCATGTNVAPAIAITDGTRTLNASRAVDELLELVTVYAVTDTNGAPLLERDASDPTRGRGRFFLTRDAAQASFLKNRNTAGDLKLEVRPVPLSDVYLPLIMNGVEAQLGGRLVLEPLPEEQRHARIILGQAAFGPLDTVPLFICPNLELESGTWGVEAFVPAFFREADLRATLKKAKMDGDNPPIGVTSLQALVEKVASSEQASSTPRKAPKIRVVLSTDRIRNART